MTERLSQFAEELLDDGTASSAQQAGWMAEILLNESLSFEARMALFHIAKTKGATFDPADITQAEIRAAVDGYVALEQKIALLFCDPAGRA